MRGIENVLVFSQAMRYSSGEERNREERNREHLYSLASLGEKKLFPWSLLAVPETVDFWVATSLERIVRTLSASERAAW
jgi:hypothetical protein